MSAFKFTFARLSGDKIGFYSITKFLILLLCLIINLDILILILILWPWPRGILVVCIFVLIILSLFIWVLIFLIFWRALVGTSKRPSLIWLILRIAIKRTKWVTITGVLLTILILVIPSRRVYVFPAARNLQLLAAVRKLPLLYLCSLWRLLLIITIALSEWNERAVRIWVVKVRP